MADEQKYRKLLRWYPRPWRERNGDALLGVMLDDAERRGRTVPSWGERRSAFTHGVGTRLDAALAWRSAIVAVVLNSGGLLWIFAAPRELRAWVPDPAVQLIMTTAPVLLVISLAAVARERGILPDPHALLATVAGALAALAGSLAWVSWSIRFDAADADQPIPLAGQLFLPLLLCAVPFRVAAVSIITDGLSCLQRLSRPVRLLIGIGAGALITPLVMGMPTQLSPYVTVLAAGAMVLAGRETRTRRTPADSVPPSGAHLARFLGAVSAILGVVGAGCFVAGVRDVAGGGELMVRGVQILCLTVWPCAAASALLVVSREPRGPVVQCTSGGRPSS